MSKEIFVVQKCLCLSFEFDTDLLSYLREDCSLRSIGPCDQTFSLSDSTRATYLAEFIRGNYLKYNHFNLCPRNVISSRREEGEKVIHRVNKHLRESVESSDVVLYVLRCGADGDALAQMPVNWRVCCLHGADTADTHRLTIVELIAIELASRWAKGC
ncbi:hypothetical protein ECG_09352 [Echinococcus granulosus]|nr:hypothetical protein ECG_09353 [Echinococcus granulosus]KAH9278472.1 hypothetical protein ECG_09288 [Echinococcus granulosus]KAH9278636.1 hypothetical protein ECG_09352 [Echinococcus granulosus]